MGNSAAAGCCSSKVVHVCVQASDPFARKDWYDVKAPTSFQTRSVGKTLVTRTTGIKGE